MTQPGYVQTHQMAGDRADIDLPERLKEIRADLPGRGRRSETVYKEGGLTVVLMTMEAGNVMPEHRAAGTTTVHVLDGRIALTSAGRTAELVPGQLTAFAPLVAHDVLAIDASAILLTVAAVAEDRGTDAIVPERGPAGT